ncbi:MAG TPA: hypothetical protein VFU19_18765 [Iamia sp.]|nr:hypothetical protein [Iamia sp.]
MDAPFVDRHMARGEALHESTGLAVLEVTDEAPASVSVEPSVKEA